MKSLYKFNVEKTVSREFTEEQDINGEVVKVQRKEDVQVPVEILIKKPSYQDRQEGVLFYNRMVNYFIREGLAPRKTMENTYSNDGGLYDKYERDEIIAMWEELASIEKELQLLNKEENKKEEKIKELEEKKNKLFLQVRDITVSENMIYDVTAEAQAGQKALMWWLFKLAYINEREEKDGKLEDNIKMLIPGDTFEAQLRYYAAFEDEDHNNWNEKDYVFFKKAFTKALLTVSAWYNQPDIKEEDFKKLEDEGLLEPDGT